MKISRNKFSDVKKSSDAQLTPFEIFHRGIRDIEVQIRVDLKCEMTQA